MLIRVKQSARADRGEFGSDFRVGIVRRDILVKVVAVHGSTTDAKGHEQGRLDQSETLCREVEHVG